MNNLLLLSALTCSLVLTPALLAQKDSSRGTSDLKEKKISLRLLAVDLLDGAKEVIIRSGGANQESPFKSQPLFIPTGNLSHPVLVPQRNITLSLLPQGEEKIGRIVAQAKLPQTGRSFLILLVPIKQQQKYLCRIVRLDDPAFRKGQICFFNLSKLPVIGKLGNKIFKVPPSKISIAKPTPQADLPYYEVRLFYKHGNKTRSLANTRWPYDDRSRSYIFFFSKGERLTYRAIDEVLHTPKDR